MEETKQQKVKQSPSLQSFKNAIRNLDISVILENITVTVVTFADPDFMILRYLIHVF